MHATSLHQYMRLFGTMVVAIIVTTYVAGCAPVTAHWSEATEAAATPTELADSTLVPLVDDALREGINALLDGQVGSDILVLKEGLLPVGSQLLTTEIDDLKVVNATVLAITNVESGQSSVSFSVPGLSTTEVEGLRGEIEWDPAGSFTLDSPLALGMAKVTLPTEVGEPLFFDWEHAKVLGVEAGQPGDDMKNAILKLYPPVDTTWEICPKCDEGTVPVGCKYPVCIPGLGCYCPVGMEAPTISTPSLLVDDVILEAINGLENGQAGSDILVLKEGLLPVGSQLLTTQIDDLKEVNATVLAITNVESGQSSVTFNVPGLSTTEVEGLRGEIEWNPTGSFTLDSPLALGMSKVTLPTEAGEPLIFGWEYAKVLGIEPGQPGDEIKNATLKLYPPLKMTWKPCPECDEGTVPVGCNYPICVPGWGCYCPVGMVAPK